MSAIANYKHFIDTVRIIAYRSEHVLAGELREHRARIEAVSRRAMTCLALCDNPFNKALKPQWKDNGMSLIILPRDTGDDSRIEAQNKLNAAIDDPLTVVLIVYGEGPEIEEALEVCVARASIKDMIRRVVWVPDPEVLSADQKARYFQQNKVAVAVGLNDKAVGSLTKTQARGRLFVERAFVKAEAS